MANDITQLRDRIHREGYDTQKTGDGHYIIVGRQGEVVRHKSGKPVTIPSTPGGSPKDLKRYVSILRDAGVLPKPAQAKVKSNGKSTTKLGRDTLKTYSDALRLEIADLINQHNLRQSDIYNFADAWAIQHGMPKPSHSAGVLSKFLKGGSLTNEKYVWLTSALSAIKRNNNQIPSMAHPQRKEEPEPAAEEPGATIEVAGESAPRQAQLPQLAMDVMQTIYREDKDHEAIMNLVQQVARLELGQR
jgi:hypothetical protein